MHTLDRMKTNAVTDASSQRKIHNIPWPCVDEAHGVFSFSLYERRACQSLITTARRRNAWFPAEVSITEADGQTRDIADTDTRAAAILDARRAQYLYRSFEKLVEKTVVGLVERTWGVRLDQLEGTQLIRYRPGGHYLAHTDSSTQGEYARRYFTVVCYLNDDFTGGRTSFPSLNFSAQPQAGKAIIFPSKYVHCAEPVKKGEKYVLITWLCGQAPTLWM